MTGYPRGLWPQQFADQAGLGLGATAGLTGPVDIERVGKGPANPTR